MLISSGLFRALLLLDGFRSSRVQLDLQPAGWRPVPGSALEISPGFVIVLILRLGCWGHSVTGEVDRWVHVYLVYLSFLSGLVVAQALV
jgi:hypothetical protein